VTLITDPASLKRRWQEREVDPKTHFGFYLGSKRSKRLLKTYRDAAKVAGLYDRWFDFIAPKPGEHYLLDTRVQPPRLIPTTLIG
jgi:hypothetical protein